MATWTALTTLTDKSAAEKLGEAMERLDPVPMGVGVFEVEDGSGTWEVGGYFTEAPDQAGLALLTAMVGAKPFTVSELPETDWVAEVRRELSPVEAGRFFVYGSHAADKVPAGKGALLLEAAMAEKRGFRDIDPADVAGAIYIGLSNSPKDVAAPLAKLPPAQVWAEFEQLISRYLDAEQGFTARRALRSDADHSDYDQLARFGEWDVTDEPFAEDLS